MDSRHQFENESLFIEQSMLQPIYISIKCIQIVIIRVL